MSPSCGVSYSVHSLFPAESPRAACRNDAHVNVGPPFTLVS